MTTYVMDFSLQDLKKSCNPELWFQPFFTQKGWHLLVVMKSIQIEMK